MSSLAAASADGYYFPPEWTPDKGSLNKFQNSHPLGKRARQIHEGILVVRFEMPFNVWCTSCNTHIGKGVRFNAKKKRAGMYFSTPIYEFLLKCATCKHDMVVRTDPKNQTYAMVSGIRQKVEAFTSDQNETEKLNDSSTSEQLTKDPFFRLEHQQEDKRVAHAQASTLERLIDLKDSRSDGYQVNSDLRKAFRKEKHRKRKQRQEAAARGIIVPMADATSDDRAAAKQVSFNSTKDRATRKRFKSIAQDQKLGIRTQSIFEHSSAAALSKAIVPRHMKQSRESINDSQQRKRSALKKARKLKINYKSFKL